MQALTSGTLAGTGSFRCVQCDYVVSLAAADALPPCPSCGGSEYVRASLFTAQHATAETVPEHMDVSAQPWLDGVRDSLDEAGQYLVFQEDGKAVVHQLSREWTRIGRSLAADVRFDDPTVSRRHALVVHRADGVRVLDDRSLNGVFVNGERVEWHALRDGDELVVGRHHLHFVDVPAVTGTREFVTIGEPRVIVG
jgi:pSer/pThr/pTyr-binding forkhead associated (FHA) protein